MKCLRKIFASSADYREVMGITLNQSLLNSSSARLHAEDVVMIPDSELLY